MVGRGPSKPERSPSPSVSIPIPSAISIAEIATDRAFQDSFAMSSLSVAAQPIAIPEIPVQTACPGIDPIPLTKIVKLKPTGPPSSENPMYWKFSINAKPNPTVKPTWNPCLGPLIYGRKMATAIALKISSQRGAPTARSENSVQYTESNGMSSGAISELNMNAGNAEAIPAISQASASLLLVGRPSNLFEVPHHARTGRENPTNQIGIPARMNASTAIISKDSISEYSIALSEAPTKITTEKMPQSCLLGGTSNIESSLTRNRENLVFIGVLRETPEDIAWASEPISSGTAN